MGIVHEIVASDVTDTRVYGRALDEGTAKLKALDMANERGQVMRVERRDTSLQEVVKSWTIKPG